VAQYAAEGRTPMHAYRVHASQNLSILSWRAMTAVLRNEWLPRTPRREEKKNRSEIASMSARRMRSIQVRVLGPARFTIFNA